MCLRPQDRRRLLALRGFKVGLAESTQSFLDDQASGFGVIGMVRLQGPGTGKFDLLELLSPKPFP